MLSNRWFTKPLLFLFILAVPVAAAGLVVVGNRVPFGTFTTVRQVDELSPFLDGLRPEQRVSAVSYTEDGRPFQTVTGDPVFFYAHPQTAFSSIQASVVFRNPSTPILELGGLAREDGQIYDLHPLQNRLLDALPWPRVTQNGLTLYQRYPTYASVDDFLTHPPEDRASVTTYHTSLATPFRLATDKATKVVRKTEVSLRGFHEMKVYVTKDEPLQFDFAYQDMNRTPGADPASIVVFNEGRQEIYHRDVADDGNVTNNATPSSLQTLRVSTDPLPEGVYKIELRAANDIFWRTYTTAARKVVFLNNLFLADEVGYRAKTPAIRLWTQAKSFALQTLHVEGVQTATIGTQALAISSAQTRFPFVVQQEGVLPMLLEKPDVMLQSNGVFAFSSEEYFEPDPKRLVWNTDVKREGVNFILTDYVPPERVGGDWYRAEVSFDPAILVLKENAWKFVLSSPGIEDAKGSFDVSSVGMIWKRK